MRNNQNGFSLLEIMIAIGLLGGLSYMLMNIMDQANKGQQGVQIRTDFDNMRNSISIILKNSELCGAGLQNSTNGRPRFNPTSALSAATVLSQIKLGGSEIAKIGANFTGGYKISKLELKDTGVPPVVNGNNTSYLVQLIVEASKGGSTKPLTNVKNPFLFNVTVNPSNQIVNCGGESPISLTYPNSCTLHFGHQDGSAAQRFVQIPFNGSGHKGLLLVGNVDGNDKFLFRGSCSPTNTPMDKFMSSCFVDLGMRDLTGAPGSTFDNPVTSATASMKQSHNSVLNMHGTVDENDSFYFRMRCPATSNEELLEAQHYITSQCYLCFGYSDLVRPQMDTRVCSRVQSMSGPTPWTRFRFTGNVDSNDIMFPGFYCKNDTGSYVKSITW